MSRIGKLPISIPAGVTVAQDKDGIVTVKGPKGELSQKVDASIKVKIEDGPQGTIKVALKYDPATRENAIKCLKRVSTPGLRKYTGYKDMPRVINGLGIAILSTSKGVMTDKEAADLKIGGEVLCYVY
jgi:ribosomal protein S8